jgi:hypothetical protein
LHELTQEVTAMSTQVNWNQFAEIEDLKDYFEEDFTGFQQLIEQALHQMEQFSEDDLDKLAELRVLEITNGCVQWRFRKNGEGSLSVDQTRECMKIVMKFIKDQEVYFPSKGIRTFSPEVSEFITEGRQLYRDAFKNNVPGAKRQYYAMSVAQFIVYGRDRLNQAMALVQKDYEPLFTPFFIGRGRNYVAPYLACI